METGIESVLSPYIKATKDLLRDGWDISASCLRYCPKWLLACVAVPTVYYSVRYVWELVPLDDLANRAIFVTGADTGFGNLLAVKCAREAGMTVFAGCFTENGRQRLADENRKLAAGQGVARGRGGGCIIPLSLDVSDEDSCQAAARFVERNLKQKQYLWALVNNAGQLALYGPDTWCTVEEEYAPAMDVNAFGMVRCVHAFLPLMKKSGCGGRIVSMSSIVGRIAYAFGAPYSMTKYAIEAFMDTIRQELRPWGITCCLLEPSGFKTPFLDEGKIHKRLDRVWSRLPPEVREKEYGEAYRQHILNFFLGAAKNASPNLHHVVDNSFHAVTARWPRLRYRCGWESLLIYVPASYLPTELEDWVLRRLTNCHRAVPIAVSTRR